MNALLYVLLACPQVPISLTREPVQTQITVWIDDLASDSIRWNATEAVSELRENFSEAEPSLYLALWSSDRQQRQLAAFILMTQGERLGHPDILIATAVEALSDDELPGFGVQNGTMPHVTNLKAAVRFLRDPVRGQLAAPELRRVLEDHSDWQARLFAADILARSGDRTSRKRVVNTLLGHLQDNHQRGDAAVALKALHAMGPTILPQIESWQPPDEQAAAGRDLLIRHLSGNPPSPQMLETMPYRVITNCVRDPIAEDWLGPLLIF